MNKEVIIYKSNGLYCLPVKQDKSPDCSGSWKGREFKTNDFVNGVGIACGSVSGNLECLDFDNHFGDAKTNLSAFIKELNGLYEKYSFPIQSTQSGGYHLLYRCSTIEGNKKLASKPKLDGKKWRPDAIIETRGEGGYFVAAPTKGYKVVRNTFDNIPEITPEERKYIIEVAKSFNQWSEPVKYEEYENKERAGDYYNGLSEAKQDMIDALRLAGWRQLNSYQWQRPNKTKGISATLGKVANNVFYVFSSNAHPFNEESGYTPFQVVALLKFNGNFKECAKWISEKYKLNTVNDYYKKKPEEKQKEKTKDEYIEILKDCMVDIEVAVEKPPVIMQINHSTNRLDDFHRIMTLGNFSCITGKSKSKKTQLIKKLIATFGINDYDKDRKFKSDLPDGKLQVLHFDTEQAEYDTWKDAISIHTIGGYQMENVGHFKLRKYKPKERLKIIETAVELFKNNLGVLVIDGVADLVHSINSEEEADNLLHLFMKWTDEYNIHIVSVLHQNKGNGFATGWLGTQILKKSELVMAVEKVADNPIYSKVTCDVIRGAKDFPEFSFFINDEGLPEINNEQFIEI
jgi:hypothetical protein